MAKSIVSSNSQLPVYKAKLNGNHQQNNESTSRSRDSDWTRAIHQQLNIKRRTCTTYIPTLEDGKDAKNSTEIKCGCKRLRREHSWDVLEDRTVKWNAKEHTTPAFNNAYGYIPHGHEKSFYIRCDMETPPVTLVRLMFDVWNMIEPKLIMCIIGGAKYFKLNERLEREFIKGIIQAALKADGWVVTTGFKTGVTKLVGDAIHDHRVTDPGKPITAIGCSKWGGVKNRQSLILKRAATNVNSDASKEKSTGEERGQQDLDPNHTHFLLLDDGTYYKYDIKDYRTRLVTAASTYRDRNVPIVTIVVEGGPDTLATIYRDLRAGIPIVLIDGSGRVPDVLAKFLARTEAMIHRNVKDDDVDWEQEIDNKDPADIEKLTNKFRAYVDEIRDGLLSIALGDRNDKKRDGLFNDFLYCLQPAVRTRIRVYSLDSDQTLDDTIFQAIIEAKKGKKSDSADVSKAKKEQLLRLALAWNAFAVAKEHVIRDDLSDLSEETRKELFLEALKQDRAHFVNSFIKLNVDISKIFYEPQMNKPWKLNWKTLSDLYKYKKQATKNSRLYEKCLKRDVESISDLDRILRHLVGDYMKSLYTNTTPGILGKLEVCCRCTPGGRVADSRSDLYRDIEIADESEVPDPEQAAKEVRELVIRDLFLWSVLTNRMEMSKVLLSHMRTRICAALIASKVMKTYKNYAHDNESKDQFAAQASSFEEYASECLKCCYTADENIACEIAIRRIDVFGCVSSLQVAVDADDKNFVGQPCCDQLLNNIWYDRIEPIQSKYQNLKFMFCCLTFGLLTPFLVKFRETKKDFENTIENVQQKSTMKSVNENAEEEQEGFLQGSKKKLSNYGINYSDERLRKGTGCSTICINYFYKLTKFHNAPVTKYFYNAVSYIFFLLLFSYYLLFAFEIPTNEIPSINWTEILVIIIVSTMLVEEIRKFLCQDNRSLYGKFYAYFVKNVFFSSIRVASYLLFYIGLIVRFSHASNDEELSVAKIILAYDLEIWFIRSLTFLGIARKMGPKLVMIRRMIIDLSFFIYIILVAMIGYGVASRTMYKYSEDPDADDLRFDGRSVFRHIIYPTYYLMYGSMDGELTALDRSPDSSTALATHVLLAFHMLFVNILLINLLIAMFSFTFDSVQSQTDLVWRYERYLLVREYFERPPLFPPFIIVTHFWELLKLVLRHLSKRKPSNMSFRRAKSFKMIGANRDVDKAWSDFESLTTNVYARTVLSGQATSAAAHVSSIDKQDVAQASTEAINSSFLNSNFDMKSITDEMSAIKRSIADLRNHAEEMNRCMQWMMNAMERVKMSRDPRPRIRSALTTSDLNPNVE